MHQVRCPQKVPSLHLNHTQTHVIYYPRRPHEGHTMATRCCTECTSTMCLDQLTDTSQWYKIIQSTLEPYKSWSTLRNSSHLVKSFDEQRILGQNTTFHSNKLKHATHGRERQRLLGEKGKQRKLSSKKKTALSPEGEGRKKDISSSLTPERSPAGSRSQKSPHAVN